MASVAIDGSKFKAVNTRDKNFTRGKVERRRAPLETSVARYLAQLDTADLQEPSEELAAKTAHLKEKLVKLESEMQRLAGRTFDPNQPGIVACGGLHLFEEVHFHKGSLDTPFMEVLPAKHPKIGIDETLAGSREIRTGEDARVPRLQPCPTQRQPRLLPIVSWPPQVATE